MEAGGGSQVGRVLDGKYRLERRLGEGGRGVVYEALHLDMGRRVAIKLLLPQSAREEEVLERFRREGRAGGRLDHPNIVTVHDFHPGSAGEDAFLVMELCEGGSLADEMRRGRLSFGRVAEVVTSIAEAISAAHEKGVIHRDLKPANVLVSRGRLKVADFGLADLGEPGPGLTGTFAVGTPLYMSPEQAQGQPADHRSDLYSLGVIAYEMLTGFPPFQGDSAQRVMVQHLTEPPIPPQAYVPEIPLPAARTVLKALEKTPERRHLSALDLARELAAALATGDADLRSTVSTTIETVKVAADEALEKSASIPLGREIELTSMRGRLQKALAGQGSLVLVAGEPGAGKTTLVEAFLARERGAQPELLSATGRCSEIFSTRPEPFFPFVEIVRALCGQLQAGRVAAFLQTLAPSWVRHVPTLSLGLRHDDSGETRTATARERMPRELADFLAALSTARPLILVLEDLHWADPSSVDLLGYLARRLPAMRVLVVATYRPDELEVARHPLRQALRGLSSSGSSSGELTPHPFGLNEVESLVRDELAASAVDPDVVAFIHRRTEGNPLFVVNLVRHLSAVGAVEVRGGVARPTRPLADLSGEVPDSIGNVIESRLERLSEEDRRLLQVAAVQGVSFDAAAVAAVFAADELDVEERLDRLHRLHALVSPTGELELPGGVSAGYRFVHALYQNALYRALLPKRKASWHQAFGQHLKKRFAHDPEAAARTLAFHFERSRDLVEAISALETAAGAALKRSPRDVEPLLLRGLELAGRLPEDAKDVERARLLTRLGRHLTEFAEIVGDVDFYGRAAGALTEALELSPTGAVSHDARTALAVVHLERGDNERCLEGLERVLAEDPRHGRAHAALAYLCKNTGLWERCLAEQAKAAECDPRLSRSIPRLSVLIYQDRFAEAFAEVDALLAERPRYSHYSYWKGIVYFYAGDLRAAGDWIRRGHELDPENPIAQGVLAFALAQEGKVEEARRYLQQAKPGAATDGTFTYWIAKIHAALGEPDRAVRWLGRAATLGYWNAPWVARDRAMASLRGNPRFEVRLQTLRDAHLTFAERVERGPGSPH